MIESKDLGLNSNYYMGCSLKTRHVVYLFFKGNFSILDKEFIEVVSTSFFKNNGPLSLALKKLWRAGNKPDVSLLSDISGAYFYLNRYIDLLPNWYPTILNIITRGKYSTVTKVLDLLEKLIKELENE